MMRRMIDAICIYHFNGKMTKKLKNMFQDDNTVKYYLGKIGGRVMIYTNIMYHLKEIGR